MKQGATMTGIKALALQPKGSLPADSKKLVTKDELNQYFYVDNYLSGISNYPGNRIITYEDLVSASFTKPTSPYYQYDVYRSGIPGASGAGFTYYGTDFQYHEIIQDSYGYVGRFCMQENSYMNNQWNVYSFSYVGICYPSYGAYPEPYVSNGYLYFTNLGSYTIEDIKVYQIINEDNAKLNALTYLGGASFLADGTALALGYVSAATILSGGVVWGALTLLTIAGGFLYGQGTHPVNSLRYLQTGSYTNGSLCIPNYRVANGSDIFHISYKVKNPQGYYPIVYGYGQYETPPPQLTVSATSCSGGGGGYYTYYITPTDYTGQYYTYGCGGYDSSNSYTVYSNNSSFLGSTRFYTNTALTIPFYGNDSTAVWWTDSTFENGCSIRISSNGNNVDQYCC